MKTKKNADYFEGFAMGFALGFALVSILTIVGLCVMLQNPSVLQDIGK